jgi:hypothetical protein
MRALSLALAATVSLAVLGGACSSSDDAADTTGAAASTLAPGTLYADAARPAMTGATGAIDTAWIDPATGAATAIPDGIYWGVTQTATDPAATTVTFDLTQAYFGEFCVAHFGDTAADDCANDYGVVTDPHALLVVPTSELTVVSVTDVATQKNYSIDGAELARLVAGQPPAATAPAGYTYVGFAYAITVTGGVVQSATQIWTP